MLYTDLPINGQKSTKRCGKKTSFANYYKLFHRKGKKDQRPETKRLWISATGTKKNKNKLVKIDETERGFTWRTKESLRTKPTSLRPRRRWCVRGLWIVVAAAVAALLWKKR